MELFFYALTGGIVALVLVLLGEVGVKKKIESLEFEDEVDRMLARVLEKFKGKIPMAGMIVKGALEEKLKDIGRREVEQAIPGIKEKIQKRMGAGFGLLRLKAVLLGCVIGIIVSTILHAIEKWS